MLRSFTMSTLLGSCLLAASASALLAQTYVCRLAPDGSRWAGACESSDDETLFIELTRQDAPGSHPWVGSFSLNDVGPLEFDLAPPRGDATGVIRTPFGWLLLEEFAEADDRVVIGFTIGNEVPPGEDDLRILDRAGEILSDPAVWDRADDRICNETDTTWSLYCALVAATIEVTGEARHRQPALQVVRRVVGEVGAARIVDHRLMNYNNHADTTFEEIREILSTARERAARLAGQPSIR